MRPYKPECRVAVDVARMKKYSWKFELGTVIMIIKPKGQGTVVYINRLTIFLGLKFALIKA
jgi:hypothetical protein